MAESRTFSLSRNSLIFLFPENGISLKMSEELKMAGYTVRGFIDKKFTKYLDEEIVKTDIAGFKKNFSSQLENIVLILCFRNGLRQEKMADLLKSFGAENIIFLPMYAGKEPLKTQEKRRYYYTQLSLGYFSDLQNIPVYSPEDCLVMTICERKQYISFWCPIHYLTGTMKDESNMTGYCKNIREISTYFSLFQWLDGDKNVCLRNYLNSHHYNTTEEQELFLQDRKNLLEVYKLNLKYNQEFFRDSPAKVKWSDGNTFHILDGLHRSVFLITQGYEKVPVITTVKDYNKFIEYMQK